VKLWISVVTHLTIKVEMTLIGPLEISPLPEGKGRKKEITASTLRNYFETIKMFCEVTDITIQ